MSKADIALCAGVLLALLVMWHWQRSHPKFDLSDLVTGDNGKVSLSKFGQATALLVSTWGFVTLVQQGKMTEFYLGIYMTVWAGAKLVQSGLDKRATAVQV